MAEGTSLLTDLAGDAWADLLGADDVIPWQGRTRDRFIGRTMTGARYSPRHGTARHPGSVQPDGGMAARAAPFAQGWETHVVWLPVEAEGTILSADGNGALRWADAFISGRSEAEARMQ